MNRTQRRKIKLKRQFVFAYAVASVLTVGVIAVLVYSAFQQRTWSLAWFGCWAFTTYQLVMLVVHVRATLRTHREHEEMLMKYSEDPQGRRHAG